MRKILTSTLSGLGIAIAAFLTGCGGGGADEPHQAPQVTSSVPAKTQQDALMTYGLQITDSAGRLVASEGLPTPHYLGTATYQETIGFVSGRGALLRYRCASPAGVPLPFLEVPQDGSVFAAVKQVVSAGSGQWDVFIIAGAQGSQSYTFTPVAPVVTAVHCFGPHPGTAGEPYGFRVYAADGSVNFSALDKPLLLDEVVTLPAGAVNPLGTLTATYGQASRTVSGLTRPAFAAHAGGQAFTQEYAGTVPYAGYSFAVNLWGSTVNRVIGVRNFAGPPESISNPGSSASYPAEDVLIVDMARYVN